MKITRALFSDQASGTVSGVGIYVNRQGAQHLRQPPAAGYAPPQLTAYHVANWQAKRAAWLAIPRTWQKINGFRRLSRVPTWGKYWQQQTASDPAYTWKNIDGALNIAGIRVNASAD